MSHSIDAFEAGEMLVSLVDKSLVVFDAERGRYRLLETMRQYARDRLLESGVGEQWRGRHLEYFVTLGEKSEPELTGSNQQEWLELLDVEHDNLRAALEWSEESEPESGLKLSGAVWRFWEVRGHFAEGRMRTDGLLHASDLGWRTTERARALHGAGVLAFRQGDYAAARTLHEESLAIRRELGDRRGAAGSLNNLGNVALEECDYAAARILYEGTLAIMRELGIHWGIAASLGNLGLVAGHLGDNSAACALHEESLSIRRVIGDRRGIAKSLVSLGSLAFERGDYAAARAPFKEGVAIMHELGDRRGIAESLEVLAAAEAALGQPLSAIPLWGAAARQRAELGAPMPQNERLRYDQQVAAARVAMLDDTAFESAWQEGRALDLDQAIELALQEPDS